MKRLFPYLTPNNIKRLFSSAGTSRGKTLGSSESDTRSKIEPSEIRLNQQSPELFTALGLMLQAGTRFPCLFITDTAGQVVWEHSDYAFDIKSVEPDVLSHLRESADTEIGTIKRLAKYPEGTRDKPMDGVVRFGFIAPLLVGKERVGILCGLNDSESSLTGSLRKQVENATALLTSSMEVAAANRQHQLEEQALNEILPFLQKGCGDAFIGMLCKKLAEMLQVELVCVVDFPNGLDQPGKTVSAVFQGVSVENFDYDLQTSPLARLKGPERVVIASKVRQQFPHDPKLQEKEIDAFAGIGLVNAKGKLSRVLMVMGREPFENPAMVSRVLEAVGPRAAAELEAAERQQQATASQQAFKQRYQRLIENDGAAMFTYSSRGTILACNSALLDCLGYSETTLQQKTVKDLGTPLHTAEAKQRYAECLEGSRSSYQIRKTYRRSDGSTFPGLATISLLPGIEKQGAIWAEAILDLSAEAKAQEEQQRLQQQLDQLQSEQQSLFEGSPFPVAQTTTAGKFIRCNGAWLQLLNYNLAEIEEKRLQDLIRENSQHAAVTGLLGKPRSADSFYQTDVLTLENKYGSKIQASLVVSPIESSGEESATCFIAIKDVSQLEKQSTEIEDLLESLSALNQLPGLSLAWLDSMGVFLRTTPETDAILGRSMPELATISIHDLMSEKQQEVRAGCQAVAQGQSSSYQWESMLQTPEGHAVYAAFSLIRVLDQGNGECLLVSCRDLSDQQRYQHHVEVQQKQMDGLLDGQSTSVLWVATDGSIDRINRAGASQFGSTPAQLKGQSILSRVTAADRASVSEPLSVTKDPTPFTVQVDMLGGPESSFPARIHARPVESLVHDSDPVWILFVEDLSESLAKKEKIAALTRQADAAGLQATALKQTAAVGICLVHPDERVSDANACLESKCGASIKSQQITLDSFFKAEDLNDTYHEGVADCLSGRREKFVYQARLNRADDASLWMEICLHPARDSKGSIVYLVAVWHDITEQTRWQDRCHGLDDPLRGLIDQGELGLIFINQAQKITQVNPVFCQLLGQAEKELQGQLVTDCFQVSDRAALKDCLQQTDGQVTLNLATTSAEPMVVRVTCQRFAPGKTGDDSWGILLVESRQKEFDLQAKADHWRKRYHALFDRRDVPMGLCDASGQLLEVNRGMQQLTSMDAHSLRFRSWSDFMPESKWKAPDPADAATLKVETTFNFNDQSSIFGCLLLEPVTGETDDSKPKFTWLLQDITQQAQAQRWGNSRDARLNAFLSNPAVGLAVLNPAGEMVEANEVFLRKLGLSPEASSGKPFADWVHPANQQVFHNQWSGLKDRQRSRFQIETVLNLEQGEQDKTSDHREETSVRITVVQLDETSTDAFASVILEDLSALRINESYLLDTTSQLEQLRTEHAELQRELTAQLESKTQELTVTRQTLENEQQQLQETSETLATEQQERQRVAEELDVLNSAHQELEEVSQAQRQQAETLQNELNDSTARGETLQTDLSAQEQHCEQLQTEIRKLQSTRDQLQTDLTSHQQELENLNEEKTGLDEKLEAQIQLTGEKEQACQELETELGTTRELCSEKTRQLETFKQMVDDYEARKGPEVDEMLQHSEIALAVVDEEQKLLQFNPALTGLLTHSSRIRAGDALEDVLGAPLSDAGSEALQQILQQESEHFHTEVELSHQDGSRRWLKISGSAIRQAGRNHVHCLLVVEDQTPLHESQRYQEALEQRFMAFAESSTIGVVMTGIDGSILFCNHPMTRLLDEEENALIGKKLNDYAHSDDPREDEKLDQRCLDGEIDDYQIEKVFVRTSGRILWTRMNAKVLRLESGEVWYAVRTIEDLTELHQKTKDLSFSGKQLSTVLHSTPAVILLLDHQGRVLEKSSGAEDWFKGDSKEAIGKKLRDLGELGTDHRFSHQLSALESGKSDRTKVTGKLVQADGHAVDATVSLNAVRDDENALKSVVAIIDADKRRSEPLTPGPDSGQDEDISFSESETQALVFTKDKTVEDRPEEKTKSKVIPKESITRTESISQYTQALKDSVKISESQRIDFSQFSLPSDQPVKTESLKKSSSQAAQLKQAWIIADSEGRIVMINRGAMDTLKTVRDQSLLKPISELLHTKEQKFWPTPGGDVSDAVATANLQEAVIWDQQMNLLTTIQMTKPIVNAAGEIKGTIVTFLPLEKVAKWPEYKKDDTTAAYIRCASLFSQTINELQSWGKHSIDEYLQKTNRLTPSELAMEAVTIEQKLSG
ncbi:MAG: PAS domain S-box protein [Verrucomicrobiota bacterium]